MEREISDGKKADLEKVACDNYSCDERGERARCYLDIYRLCPKYDPDKTNQIYFNDNFYRKI